MRYSLKFYLFITITVCAGIRAAGQNDEPLVPVSRHTLAEWLQSGKSTVGDRMLFDSPVLSRGEVVKAYRENGYDIKRYELKPSTVAEGCQTVVKYESAGRRYVMDLLSIDTRNAALPLKVRYRIPPNFQASTWSFSKDKDNFSCDLVLFDRDHLTRQQVSKLDKMNSPVINDVGLGKGTPLLLVRVFFTGRENIGFDVYPRVVTDNGARYISIDLPQENPQAGILFYPYRCNEESITTTLMGASGRDIRQSFYDFDLHLELGSDPTLFAMQHKGLDGNPVVEFGHQLLDSGMQKQNSGKLIASFDFEDVREGRVIDSINGISAMVKDVKIVDAGVFGGKALYLGDKFRKSEGEISVSHEIKKYFTQNQCTFSWWVKRPLGAIKFQYPYWFFYRGGAGIPEGFLGGSEDVNLGFVSLKSSYDGMQYAGVYYGLHGYRHQFSVRKSTMTYDNIGWQNVALSIDGDKLRLFHNGRLGAEYTTPKSFTPEFFTKDYPHFWTKASDPLVFMKGYWGCVDKIRIYDYALSEAQLRQQIEHDIPLRLLSYPCEDILDSKTSSDNKGAFPIDVYSVKEERFEPEGDFSALVEEATLVSGVKGNAIRLEKQPLAIPFKAMIDGGQSVISLGFWVRPENGSFQLVNSDTHWNKGFNIAYNHGKWGGIICAVRNPFEQDEPVPIVPEEWSHIYMGYDGRFLIVYLNGEPVVKTPLAPKTKLDLKCPLLIGKGLVGAVDEIQLFRRMLRTEEIKVLSSKGRSATKPPKKDRTL